MGEAKRRAAQWETWFATLTSPEQKVAEVAQRVHRAMAQERAYVGACYYYAFFLRRYLLGQGIEVVPVVGWAVGKRAAFSHAWVEYQGKKTDVSLSRSPDPIAVPPGDLLILDYVAQAGRAQYQYVGETTPEIDQIVRADGEQGVARLQFNARMREVAADDALILDYFDNAPAEFRYEVTVRRIEGAQ